MWQFQCYPVRTQRWFNVDDPTYINVFFLFIIFDIISYYIYKYILFDYKKFNNELCVPQEAN